MPHATHSQFRMSDTFHPSFHPLTLTDPGPRRMEGREGREFTKPPRKAPLAFFRSARASHSPPPKTEQGQNLIIGCKAWSALCLLALVLYDTLKSSMSVTMHPGVLQGLAYVSLVWSYKSMVCH